MTKLTQLHESMSKQDIDNYHVGFNADITESNPHDENADIRNYQGWSAGHFDRHGRV